MNNVLLDPLPEGYEADDGIFYPLDFNFRIGIQIALISEDTDLDLIEKVTLTQDLLFLDAIPADQEIAKAALNFYVNGWFLDRQIENRHKGIKTSDFNVDQWRIYAGFLSQYQIDLNTIEYMHYWVFMGLLTNLNECSYTRVLDIRMKKVPKGLKGEDLQNFKDAKEMYKLGHQASKEEVDEKARLIEEYNLITGSKISDKEKKAIEIFESYSDKE